MSTGHDATGPGVPVSELSYTEASRELDRIVEFFEQREVDVDQLVARLERAAAIVDELDRRIRRTRTQVEQLVPRLEAARRTPPPEERAPATARDAGHEAWDVAAEAAEDRSPLRAAGGGEDGDEDEDGWEEGDKVGEDDEQPLF